MLELIIGFILGGGLLGLILGSKVKTTIKIDNETKDKNLLIEQENENLQNLQVKITEDIDRLNAQKEDIQKDIEVLKKIAEQTSENYLKSEMQLAEEKFDRAMEKLGSDYEQNKEEYEQLYLSDLKECTAQFVSEIKKKQTELQNIDNKLTEYKKRMQSLILCFKEQEENKNKNEFHSVVISKDDKDEIYKLREVGKYLRDQDLLNKIVWKGYYEKPTSLMLGRVVGTDNKTGIYKITNLKNQMSYIGQATNIANRWKQHIKRGLGAEAPTRNKLYPAMFTDGIENFTFEIIQECSADKLNELEAYWIDFFETQSYGYNVTKGVNTL